MNSNCKFILPLDYLSTIMAEYFCEQFNEKHSNNWLNLIKRSTYFIFTILITTLIGWLLSSTIRFHYQIKPEPLFLLLFIFIMMPTFCFWLLLPKLIRKLFHQTKLYLIKIFSNIKFFKYFSIVKIIY